MKALTESISIENIRSYSREDHAYERAIKILSSSNVDFDSFFNSILNYKPELNKSCDFTNNKEPSTNLVNDYNSVCWRYWRVKQLEI